MEAELLNAYVDGPMAYYHKPSLSCLQTAEQLFQQLLERRCICGEDKWSSLGLRITKFVECGVDFAVVSESPKCRGRGSGFYIVKLASSSSSSGCSRCCSAKVCECEQQSLVVQVMHRPSDLHIHHIAFKLLLEGKHYSAAAWNTLHRSKTDLGKEPASYFNSFTSAVARSAARPRIVQLHAFDAKLHKINGDMILSSARFQETSPAKQEQVDKVVSRMRSELKGFIVLQFPADIRKLGGTLNVNARVFYAANPHGLFFHVEMSLPLRLSLRDRADVRSCFSRCF